MKTNLLMMAVAAGIVGLSGAASAEIVTVTYTGPVIEITSGDGITPASEGDTLVATYVFNLPNATETMIDPMTGGFAFGPYGSFATASLTVSGVAAPLPAFATGQINGAKPRLRHRKRPRRRSHRRRSGHPIDHFSGWLGLLLESRCAHGHLVQSVWRRRSDNPAQDRCRRLPGKRRHKCERDRVVLVSGSRAVHLGHDAHRLRGLWRLRLSRQARRRDARGLGLGRRDFAGRRCGDVRGGCRKCPRVANNVPAAADRDRRVLGDVLPLGRPVPHPSTM
jgi:hypothetical protein